MSQAGWGEHSRLQGRDAQGPGMGRSTGRLSELGVRVTGFQRVVGSGIQDAAEGVDRPDQVALMRVLPIGRSAFRHSCLAP